MKKSILLLVACALSGCATVTDAPKNIVGISTRGIEAARVEASSGDFQADFTGLYDAVLAVAKENNYYIFSQDEVRGLIVFMNVPGFVDTTEVGIFISPLKSGEFRVEVSSRSAPAKEAVASVIFEKLADRYKKV
jgi:hypothetical protein